MNILKFAGIAVLLIPLFAVLYVARAQWYTRQEALVGTYVAEGAWGSSTLKLNANHTFQQTGDFRNQFNYRHAGTVKVAGTWFPSKRTLVSQEFTLSEFVEISPLNGGAIRRPSVLSYSALDLSFGIMIDPGAGIYYWKRK